MNSIYQILVITLIGIVYGITLYQVLIPIFTKFKFGQSIREEGPRNHLNKKGTPTMGGIMIFLLTIIMWTIFLINNFNNYLEILLLLISFVGFMIIGLLDDLLIIIKHNNEGIKPQIKFLLQLLISAISFFIILLIKQNTIINFFGYKIDLNFVYGIFLLFAYSGFSNATNLTDGLDGLLGGSYLIVSFGLCLIAYFNQNYNVLYFSISLIVSLITFLIFNLPKASIFMGDTGSLSLGAVFVSMFVLLDMDILIFIFGLLYLIEVISVMLQVWFFKKTSGKRLFKMTPIHHHLEIVGLKDIQIDVICWIISLVFVVGGLVLGVLVF